jgi:hypothetical protein
MARQKLEKSFWRGVRMARTLANENKILVALRITALSYAAASR